MEKCNYVIFQNGMFHPVKKKMKKRNYYLVEINQLKNGRNDLYEKKILQLRIGRMNNCKSRKRI